MGVESLDVVLKPLWDSFIDNLVVLKTTFLKLFGLKPKNSESEDSDSDSENSESESEDSDSDSEDSDSKKFEIN